MFEMSNVWRTIYWYCQWAFGRDSYEEKIIIIDWYDFIVVQEWIIKRITQFDSEEEKTNFLEENSSPDLSWV